jgi:predicted flap endonuclease-1-like 5' DNA nuclease
VVSRVGCPSLGLRAAGRGWRFLAGPDWPSSAAAHAIVGGDRGGATKEDKMSEHVVNDLDNLKGIGPHYKEMLKSIGVDSIKELRHRNAAHLKEMIEERHGPVVGLSEHETQTWIDEAKAYQE